ncbi:hypothetical protein B0H17DRAFT_1133147 [Mycena rosella]|uniref:Uncharacterized protein n=1 Tax=Mycena rosella TaxID=1033263 RepID=A0AAD7DLK7_MYCRO|nr:hypothetical protein B0H17DRAFT_1133147 [Mycena rosella]
MHIFKSIAIASTLILGVLAVPVPMWPCPLEHRERYVNNEDWIDSPACAHVAEFSVQPGLINLNDPPRAPNSTTDNFSQGVSKDRHPKYLSSANASNAEVDRSGFMVFREMHVKNEALKNCVVRFGWNSVRQSTCLE